MATEIKINEPTSEILKKQRTLINKRRQESQPAKIFNEEDRNFAEIAAMIAAGGVVVLPFGQEIRRIPIIAARYDQPEATKILNELKGRPGRQVLAVGCLTETTEFIADIEDSVPLLEATKRLTGSQKVTKRDLLATVEHLYDNNAVGLLFKAKDFLPKEVTSDRGADRIVMVVGATDRQDKHDTYNNVMWELSTRYGMTLAGTSLNKSGESVVSYRNQDQIYEEMKYKVDGFIKYTHMPPDIPKNAASSTVIDLSRDKPFVKRWGNQHPARFKKFFPDLLITPDTSREENAETRQKWIQSIVLSKIPAFLR